MKDVNVENVSLIIFKLNENTNEKFNSSMLKSLVIMTILPYGFK